MKVIRKRKAALTLVAAIVALAVLFTAVRGQNIGTGESTSESDWGIPVAAQHLFAQSHIIVSGSVSNIEYQDISLRSPVPGEAEGERQEELWALRVSSAWRGGFEPGDTIPVRVATSTTLEAGPGRPAIAEPIDVARPAQGVEHVFFLRHFNDEGGDGIGLTGPVAVARVEGERLEFLYPTDYLLEYADKPRASEAYPELLDLDDLTIALMTELERVLSQWSGFEVSLGCE